MANVFVNEDSLSDIADAIRSKLNVQTTYKPGEMAAAIESISGGGITPTGTKSITANGTYDVTSYASAEVNVPTGSTPVINSLSVTENGTYTAPSGVDGYSPVTVNVPTGGGSSLPKTGTITPEARTTSMTIDLGDSSISSVNGVVIAPTDSTPLLSGGKTCSILLALPGLFYQSVAVVTNNAGSAYGVAPNISTSDDRISISNGVITVTAPNAFEAISHTWYVW